MSLKKRVRAQWEQHLAIDTEFIRNVPSIASQKPSRDDIPRVVNVVTTFQVISQEKIKSGPQRGKRRFHLPLTSLVMKFPPGKFSPRRFAAVILRVRDHSCHFTALIFESGKVVVVHTLSEAHSLMASQMVRQILSNVEVVIQDRFTGRLYLDYLGPHITFSERRMRNFVLSGDLGNRIDLQALVDAAPSIVSWSCDGFPGAEVTTRIRRDDECTCNPAEKIKCGCKIKCLIFQPGSIVITGATSVEDGNRVFYLFKSIAPQFDDTAAPIPKEKRYATRLAQMLNRVGEPVTIKRKRGRKKGTKIDDQGKVTVVTTEAPNPQDQQRDDAEDGEAMYEAVAHALQMHHPEIANSMTRNAQAPSGSTVGGAGKKSGSMTSLMQAVEQGQINLVRSVLGMGLDDIWAVDENDRNAFERLEELIEANEADGHETSIAHREILSLLKTHMVRHPRQ